MVLFYRPPEEAVRRQKEYQMLYSEKIFAQEGRLIMDYQNRSDLEDLTSAYLDALERQDRKGLQKLWSGAPTDRIISIYGYFENVSRTQDEYEEVFSQKGMTSFTILDSSFEIQHLSSSEALLTLFYKVGVLLKGNKSILPQQIIETLFCIRTDQGWKITYAHQTLQEPLPDSRYQQMQSERLQSMIEMLAKAENKTVSMPRSLRERQDLFHTLLLEWQGEDPDMDYLNLEEEAYEDENNRTTYTLPAAVMSEDQQIAAWKGSPAGFMADSYITFNEPETTADARLSIYAGIMLQADNARLWKKASLQDGYLVHTEPGWYLPCRTIQEVFLKPVYGLYTLEDRKIFSAAFEEALDQAEKSGAQSLLITPEWRNILHIPSRAGMDEMLTLLQKRLDDPDSTIQQAVFLAEKSDTYRKIRNMTRLWTRQMARRQNPQNQQTQ